LAVAGGSVWFFAWMLDDRPQPAPTESCQWNMRQLSTALLMYEQDWDGYLPPLWSWQSGLPPYAKDPRIYQCPSDKAGNSYALNENLVGLRTEEIIRPEATLLFFESNLHLPNAEGLEHVVARPPRHFKRNNWAFLDGHAKSSPVTPSFSVLLRGRRHQSDGKPP
jgi:prepilin-type processing-associated H-X9-DG protein